MSKLRLPGGEITTPREAGGKWDQPRHQGVEEEAGLQAAAEEEGDGR